MSRALLLSLWATGLLACASKPSPSLRGAPAAAGASSDHPVLQTAPSQPSGVTRSPVAIDQTASLTPAELEQLAAGGPVGSARLLYPYEGTVFPRGLLPPTLMWGGADDADAAYVHLYASGFDYRGALRPVLDPGTHAPGVPLPEEVWTRAGAQTLGKGDPFTLELTLRAQGRVLGPLTLRFTIAAATVKGSIYYNSYASKLPGAALGGNVLRIPSGGKAELFSSVQCNGCHAVSANGAKMLSQIELQGGGSAYDLLANGPANPPGKQVGARVSFGALYPDGSKYLSTTTAVNVAHAETAQPANTPPGAALYDTTTGAAVPDTGIPESAAMPMFSPDGAQLVFTDAAVSGGDALAVMRYDVRQHRASGYRELYRDAESTRPGWPFFLPDGKAVVFVRTASPDFSANGAYIGAGVFAALAGPFASLASAPVPGPLSDLYIADLASGKVSLLAQAMGFASEAATTTSLPFADDTHQSYFPTVAPIAAGGYFWVFFDGIRHYGNQGIQRQLWGFAIDIQASGGYARDVSHPAFYLPGQEPGAGNHRAFAALDPCKADGESCTSGIDCCAGACGDGKCAPPKGCATRDERCAHDSDCCASAAGEPPSWCIAGFCAFVPLN
jgi:hypothetical protein